MSNMERHFSAGSERKIVAAYIRSNIFFPQLRFAFVLALFREADSVLMTELHKCVINPDTAIENIILAADRTHKKYGVMHILPTKPSRVIEELEKSVEVSQRFVAGVEDHFEAMPG